MALSFQHPTTSLQDGDAHPEVTDALLGFVYDPPGPDALDALLLLNIPDAKKPRACTHDPVQLVVRKTTGDDGSRRQRVQSATARVRRNRISAKTAELSRLIPAARNLSTAEMLEEAARHVKLLQAQVGMLALMHAQAQKEEVPVVAQEQMHALLARGSVQQRLAAEGRCLVPRQLVDAVARDKAVVSNALVNRDLGRFMASLEQ